MPSTPGLLSVKAWDSGLGECAQGCTGPARTLRLPPVMGWAVPTLPARWVCAAESCPALPPTAPHAVAMCLIMVPSSGSSPPFLPLLGHHPEKPHTLRPPQALLLKDPKSEEIETLPRPPKTHAFMHFIKRSINTKPRRKGPLPFPSGSELYAQALKDHNKSCAQSYFWPLLLPPEVSQLLGPLTGKQYLQSQHPWHSPAVISGAATALGGNMCQQGGFFTSSFSGCILKVSVKTRV